MKYRDILIPLACAVGGFAAGWFAHKHVQEDKTAAALKKQADMYKEQIKTAVAAAKKEGAEEEFTRAQEEQVAKDKKMYEGLRPGFYSVDEYNALFKTPAPSETFNDDGKEGTDIRQTMDEHGDPLDDIIYEGDETDYVEYPPFDPTVDYEVLYIRPEEVGKLYGFEEVDLKVFADGIVTDDVWQIIPSDEAEEMLGEDFMSHMGEYEEEAFWCVNRRNHKYYEVLYDSRTYREAIGRG